MLPEVMTKQEWCKIPVYKKGYTYSVTLHSMYVDFIKYVTAPSFSATLFGVLQFRPAAEFSQSHD